MNHANQTKLMLTQSLQDLMLHTPLEKISVQDIVDHAGVGRNTFYYHFADKYDLVNWYFQDTATRFLVERQAFTDWTSMLRAVEAYFRAHKVFYQNALSYNGQNSLQEYIFEFLCDVYAQQVDEMLPDASEEDRLRIGRFLSGATLGVLVPWVQSGMKESNLQNDRWLEYLTSGTLHQLMGDFLT